MTVAKAPHARTAELFGQLGRDDAHLAHRLHHAAIENAGLVALLKPWRDAIGREPPRLIGQRQQVFIEIWVHRSAS
jgi:hypothetical protein